MSKKDFKELGRTKVSNKRYVVISKNNFVDGYTMAQLFEAQDGRKGIDVFIKGAIHISSIEGLYNLRDILNVILANEDNKK